MLGELAMVTNDTELYISEITTTINTLNTATIVTNITNNNNNTDASAEAEVQQMLIVVFVWGVLR